MMMIAAAGHGHERRALYDNSNKPIPRWIWGAVGVSILAHAAGAVWLYNQRYDMPAPEARPVPDSVTVTMDRPWEPPIVETEEPPAPPLPVHDPVVIRDTEVAPSPFEVPDEPVTVPAGEGPIRLDPGPVPDTTGTTLDPTPPAPAVIRNPQWIQRPTVAQLERAYPSRAAEAGIGGRAVLSCSVQASGEVTACDVVSETPQGQGFGRAAVSLSRYFRLSPRTVDGRAIEGSRVTIPLSFNIG